MKIKIFLRAMRRYLALTRASARDTSFAGEFRHIDFLIESLKLEIGYVVDIAASDGVSQSSTLPLFRRGWKGLAVEMDPNLFAGLAFIYQQFDDLRLARSRVTPLNIVNLLLANEVPKDFDVLNLDIDSYDLSLIEAMIHGGFRPKIISMEINEKIPPPIYFSVNYDDTHYWKGDHFYGCSLTAAGEILRNHEYLLHSVEYNNAFFVAREWAVGLVDVDDRSAYTAGYSNRADRALLFPWNSDMEDLQTMEAQSAVASLEKKFAKYRGQFTLHVN